MAKRDGDFSEVSYILGISSIILALFQPIAGFVFGVVGFAHGRKQSGHLSNKARKLNMIGMVLSILFFIVTLIITFKYSKVI